jgi:hypothetical protein
LTVGLVAKDEQVARLPLSDFGPVQTALKTVLKKANWLGDFATVGPVEQVMQIYELSTAAFVQANPQFNPADLQTIRFCFDRTLAGTVMLDNIRFYQAGIVNK